MEFYAPAETRYRTNSGEMRTEGVSQPDRPSADRGGQRSQDDVRVWMLGGFRVSVGPDRTIEESDWRLRKAASLVKVLALAPGHRLHREQVIDLLWPEMDRTAAANNLRQALHVARKTLDPDPKVASAYVSSVEESLVLCPGGNLLVDVEAFEASASAARRSRDPAAYVAALELHADELLPADRYEEWTEGRRQELGQLRLALLVELARICEVRGEHERGIEALRRVLREEPISEETHASLMRLYALAGRRQEALLQYKRLRESLFRELGTVPAAESGRLYEEIRSGSFPASPSPYRSPPSEASADSGRHNLPSFLTSFVGRESEMVEARRLLSMGRMLTLTGAGGSGKTRLALEVARGLVALYPDGVWLAELAPLSEPDLVPRAVAAAVAKAVEVREQPGTPLLETLLEVLGDKEMLLVLDNCEHLPDAVACNGEALLHSCPRLRVLATSREPLGIRGEVLSHVRPLSLPDDTQEVPDGGTTAEGLMRYEAVRLFVDRARLKLPDFALTEENASEVVKVCRKLDGIPLAIELATARIGHLAVEQVAQRLEASLDVLRSESRGAEARQRTLRATLDWSHDLLSEAERAFFMRLSVFAGGWTLEAAEAVCCGGSIERHDVLDLLGGLVDKSLVEAKTGTGGAVRYRMLEPIRQYAHGKLEASEGAEKARERHAAFFLAMAEEVEPELRGGAQQGLWLQHLEREHSNLRAALSWTLDSGEVEAGLRLCGALGEFWYHRGHVNEGRRWLRLALAERGAPSASVKAKARALAGWLAWEQGDYEQSETLIGEGLKLYRELGDTARVASALFDLGMAALYQMHCERAAAPLEEALALHDALGDRTGVARDLYGLGMLAWAARQDYERATALHEEGLALAHEAGDNYGILLSLALGTVVYTDQGDYLKAKELNEQGLGLSRRLEMRRMVVFNLHLSATLAISQGQAVRSTRLWGAAKALREAIGASFSPLQHYYYGPYIDATRAQLGEAAWEAAFAEGRTMTTEDAVDYALSGKAPASSDPRVPKSQQSTVLTPREKEVALLVARGLTNRQVASELSISERTAGNHVARILRKLGFRSRTQIVDWISERNGLTLPDAD